MKKSELTKIICEIVQSEAEAIIKEYMRAYIPAMVGIVLPEILDEQLDVKLAEIAMTKPNKPSRALKESFTIENDMEEWPTMKNSRVMTSERAPAGVRAALAAKMGYGDMPSPNGNGTLNIPTTMLTDSGIPVPISPDQVPEDVVVAVNKDYRGFMEKICQKNNRC